MLLSPESSPVSSLCALLSRLSILCVCPAYLWHMYLRASAHGCAARRAAHLTVTRQPHRPHARPPFLCARSPLPTPSPFPNEAPCLVPMRPPHISRARGLTGLAQAHSRQTPCMGHSSHSPARPTLRAALARRQLTRWRQSHHDPRSMLAGSRPTSYQVSPSTCTPHLHQRRDARQKSWLRDVVMKLSDGSTRRSPKGVDIVCSGWPSTDVPSVCTAEQERRSG